jgi:lipid A 3-O-deacylase
MRQLLAIAILCSGAMVTAIGQEEKSTLSITVENDSFLGTDCYYTQGMRIQYMHEANQLPEWTARFLTNFPTLGMDVSRMRIGGAVGQEIYTPRRISRSAPIVTDRPYAAWLHGSLILRRSGEFLDQVPVMDEMELDLGVVGPAALGEETQKWWHDLLNQPEPKGWDNQISNEPAIQLFFTRSFQFGFRSENYWGFDVVPHVKAALGNVYIYGEVGTMLRAGYNLPPEYIISPIESFSTHPSYDPPKWAAYVFAGADGRAVGRNIFLDGNTFKESPSIEKETFVGDFRVGGAVRYKGVEAVVSLVERTREFVLQPRNEEFLSITFQFHF